MRRMTPTSQDGEHNEGFLDDEGVSKAKPAAGVWKAWPCQTEEPGCEKRTKAEPDPEAGKGSAGVSVGVVGEELDCCWGWVITFAAFTLMSVAMTPYNNFGVLFSGFMLDLGVSHTMVSWIFSLTFVSSCLFSFLAGPLVDEFGWRRVAFISSLIFSLGLGLSAFAPSAEFLFFSCSLLMGMNIELLHNLAQLVIPRYFTKRRSLANSVMTSGVCLNQMIVPHLAAFLQREYGVRATILLVAAFALNNCPAAMVLHPVEWHMRNFHGYEAGGGQYQPAKKSVSLSDLLLGLAESLKSNFRYMVSPQVFLVSNAIAINSTSFFNLFNLVPFSMQSKGHTPQQVALCLSVSGAFNLVSRLMMCLQGQESRIKRKWVYMAGSTISAFGTLVFSMVEGVAWKAGAMGVCGLGCGALMAVYNLVIVEQLGMKMLLPVLSITSLFKGVWFISCGPLIGVMQDWSGSYTSSLYLLTAMFLVSVLFWLILPVARTLENYRRSRAEQEIKGLTEAEHGNGRTKAKQKRAYQRKHTRGKRYWTLKQPVVMKDLENNIILLSQNAVTNYASITPIKE